MVFTCLQFKSSENTVGKGEIAHNEQFLLFPQCFLPVWRTFCHFHEARNCRLQTLSVWKSQNFVVWERVNSFDQTPDFRLVQIRSFNFADDRNSGSIIVIHFGKRRKHCGKRRKCWLPAFSPCPTMFSTLSWTSIVILITFILLSSFNLDQAKILLFGKGQLNNQNLQI